MRLFIAIQLSEKMKDALVKVQDQMRRTGVRGNFTARGNLHLTLAFIGEYPDAENVLDIIDGIEFEPFRVRLNGLGSFGRLWWAGLEGGGELETLCKRLRRDLSKAGIPYDRKKFSPHITLVRKPVSQTGAIPPEALESLKCAGMTVDHISLMRSDRGKHGMIYTEL